MSAEEIREYERDLQELELQHQAQLLAEEELQQMFEYYN